MYNKILVPPNTDELKIKLLAIIHAGRVGHCGSEATAASLCESFFMLWMEGDYIDFVDNCLHWITSRSEARVPLLLAKPLQSDVPGEFLRFDYIFLETNANDIIYALHLKDDFNWYARLSMISKEIASHTVDIWHVGNERLQNRSTGYPTKLPTFTTKFCKPCLPCIMFNISLLLRTSRG